MGCLFVHFFCEPLYIYYAIMRSDNDLTLDNLKDLLGVSEGIVWEIAS